MEVLAEFEDSGLNFGAKTPHSLYKRRSTFLYTTHDLCLFILKYYISHFTVNYSIATVYNYSMLDYVYIQ
jgi:hypothetical protein